MLEKRDGVTRETGQFCYILGRMSPSTVPQDPRRELEMLLASRFALIVIESREEARVLTLVRESSLKARRGRGWGVFQWTVTEGLQRVDVDMGAPQRSAEPAQLLKHLKATPMPGIYVLLDFHPYLTDPVNVRMLKDVAQGYEQVARTVVLMSYEVTLPEELETFATRMHLALPSTNERQSRRGRGTRAVCVVDRRDLLCGPAGRFRARGHNRNSRPQALGASDSPGGTCPGQAKRGFLWSGVGTGNRRRALQCTRPGSPGHRRGGAGRRSCRIGY